jgi:hypothetical protein
MWHHVLEEHSCQLRGHENPNTRTFRDNKCLLSHAQVALQVHAEKHYLDLCLTHWCPKYLNAGHSDKCDLTVCHKEFLRT